MSPARRVIVVAAALCGVLTGCALPGATPSGTVRGTTPTPRPLTGSPFGASGFSTIVPAGWTNRLGDSTEVDKFNANGKVVFLVEQGPPGTQQQNVNDVTANINVVLLAPAVPDDQVITYLQSVANHGATNLSTPQSFTIDGSTGQSITYDRDIQGTPGESQDMIVNHAGTTYEIVLNSSQYAFNDQIAGMQAVLTAWRWSG